MKLLDFELQEAKREELLKKAEKKREKLEQEAAERAAAAEASGEAEGEASTSGATGGALTSRPIIVSETDQRRERKKRREYAGRR